MEKMKRKNLTWIKTIQIHKVKPQIEEKTQRIANQKDNMLLISKHLAMGTYNECTTVFV